jgi:hypothetical protein
MPWARPGNTAKPPSTRSRVKSRGSSAAATGYALVKAADANGTSPGKDVLRGLLQMYAPCVVLMDELVAYIRQFADSAQISGGTYDSKDPSARRTPARTVVPEGGAAASD